MGGIGYDKTLFNKAVKLKQRAALWNGVGSVVGNLVGGFAHRNQVEQRAAATQDMAKQAGVTINPTTAEYIEPGTFVDALMKNKAATDAFGRQKELETFRTNEDIRQDQATGATAWRGSQVDENKRQAAEYEAKTAARTRRDEALRGYDIDPDEFDSWPAEAQTAKLREIGRIPQDPDEVRRSAKAQEEADAAVRARAKLAEFGIPQDVYDLAPAADKSRLLQDSGAVPRAPTPGTKNVPYDWRSDFHDEAQRDEFFASRPDIDPQRWALSSEAGRDKMLNPRAQNPTVNAYARQIGVADYIISQADDELDGPLYKDPNTGQPSRMKEQGLRHQIEEQGDEDPTTQVLKNRVKKLEAKRRDAQARKEQLEREALSFGGEGGEEGDEYENAILDALRGIDSEIESGDGE